MEEDKRHGVMGAGKQGNSCQMSSFQEGQRGYLLSTEDCHDFMNLENMKMVWNSCNEEVGCSVYFTYVSWVCPAWCWDRSYPQSPRAVTPTRDQKWQIGGWHMCYYSSHFRPMTDIINHNFLPHWAIQSHRVLLNVVLQVAITTWLKEVLEMKSSHHYWAKHKSYYGCGLPITGYLPLHPWLVSYLILWS